MIIGDFVAITGTIRNQDLQRSNDGGSLEVMEVEFVLDANGVAEAVIPFASGAPFNYLIKRGTGVEQPAATFDVVVTCKIGAIAKVSSVIFTAAGVAADVGMTAIATGPAVKYCGAVNVKIQNSNVSNAGKSVIVLLVVSPIGRNLTQ
jgi:hypothetical protein